MNELPPDFELDLSEPDSKFLKSIRVNGHAQYQRDYAERFKIVHSHKKDYRAEPPTDLLLLAGGFAVALALVVCVVNYLWPVHP